MSVRLLATVASLALALPALAAVDARVDRNRVDVNESFSLTIETDDTTATLPDLSELERDFDLLGTHENVSTQIIQSRISQTRRWVLTLMPKREGRVIIPALTVGNAKTLPLTITVNPPVDGRVGGEDVIVVAELDTVRTWVQAQAIYTLRIYTAVSPRQPRLATPQPEGADALFQQLGDDTRFESFLDGRTYNVVERRYALFPQASGTVTIPEVHYTARIWEGGRLSPRRAYKSNAVQLTVEPIPPPPQDHPNAAWLPAKDVTLSERWSPSNRLTAAGEPISRTIRVSATGLTASQLPELPAPAPDGLRVYPDQPELDTREVAGDVVAYRTERFALIGASAGRYPVKPYRLPWWNTVAGRWEVATLPGAEITVSGAAAPGDEAAASGPAAPVEIVETPTVWRAVAIALAAGWLLTAVAWRWRSRPRRRPRAAAPAPGRGFRRERRLIREAEAAVLAGHSADAARHLREW
ncbi:MAG: BatD family protein, partial [Pseudomonadota bacterium]